MERLRVIEETHDGFLLAEEDLRLRGPGEFFGTRQSGVFDLRMARLSDMDTLELARREAEYALRGGPGAGRARARAAARPIGRLLGAGQQRARSLMRPPCE